MGADDDHRRAGRLRIAVLLGGLRHLKIITDRVKKFLDTVVIFRHCWVITTRGVMAMGNPSLAGLDPTPLDDQHEIGSSIPDIAKLQSKVDQAYRLAWLAGDDLTSERLLRYARQLEAFTMPP
jgi:hypothetical protein